MVIGDVRDVRCERGLLLSLICGAGEERKRKKSTYSREKGERKRLTLMKVRKGTSILKNFVPTLLPTITAARSAYRARYLLTVCR